ncbi:MAG TPA: AraC family transcriptional regulator [Luteitalea sp.]|nr:AraC family transcriptional regulator [Luteitalea sp.]
MLNDVASRIDALAGLLRRLAVREGMHPTRVPRLSVIRYDRAGEPMPTVYAPSICVVAQGSKVVRLGTDRFSYDPSRFIVASVDLPVMSHVEEASPDAPYLCMSLEFAPKEIAAVVLDAELEAADDGPPARGMFVGDATPALLDAVVRLTQLAETPDDIAALAPLVEREILYRLLRGPDGWRLRQMARGQGQARRIARAIAWIKAHFAEPLRVEALARDVNMSVSSFHAHFKHVTAMSPLQYQKQMRLQEARRLLMSDDVDAATAGHLVGYESPSQFSREYRRAYGVPPATDARVALRALA